MNLFNPKEMSELTHRKLKDSDYYAKKALLSAKLSIKALEAENKGLKVQMRSQLDAINELETRAKERELLEMLRTEVIRLNGIITPKAMTSEQLIKAKANESRERSLIKYSRRNQDRARFRKRQVKRLKGKLKLVRKWVASIHRKIDNEDRAKIKAIIKHL